MQKDKKIAGMYSSVDQPASFINMLAHSLAERNIRENEPIELLLEEAQKNFKLDEREMFMLINQLKQLNIDVVPNEDQYYIPVSKRASLSKTAEGSRTKDMQEQLTALKNELSDAKKWLKENEDARRLNPQTYNNVKVRADVLEKRIDQLSKALTISKQGFFYTPYTLKPVKDFTISKDFKVFAKQGSRLVVYGLEEVSTEPIEASEEEGSTDFLELRQLINKTEAGSKLYTLFQDYWHTKPLTKQALSNYITSFLDFVLDNLSMMDLSGEEVDTLVKDIKEFVQKHDLDVPENYLNPAFYTTAQEVEQSDEEKNEEIASDILSEIGAPKTASSITDKSLASTLIKLDRVATLAELLEKEEKIATSKSASEALSELKRVVGGLRKLIDTHLPYVGEEERKAYSIVLSNVAKDLQRLYNKSNSKEVYYISASELSNRLKKAANMLLTIEEE